MVFVASLLDFGVYLYIVHESLIRSGRLWYPAASSSIVRRKRTRTFGAAEVPIRAREGHLTFYIQIERLNIWSSSLLPPTFRQNVYVKSRGFIDFTAKMTPKKPYRRIYF